MKGLAGVPGGHAVVAAAVTTCATTSITNHVASAQNGHISPDRLHGSLAIRYAERRRAEQLRAEQLRAERLCAGRLRANRTERIVL